MGSPISDWINAHLYGGILSRGKFLIHCVFLGIDGRSVAVYMNGSQAFPENSGMSTLQKYDIWPLELDAATVIASSHCKLHFLHV